MRTDSTTRVNHGRLLRGMALVMALFVCVSADAQVILSGTYYVRTTGSNGDVGTSSGKAWRTISHALSQTSPGDTIYVGAGTYSERLDTSHAASGTKVLKIIGDTTGSYTGDAGVVQVKYSGPTVRHRGTGRLTYQGVTIHGNSSGDMIWVEQSDEFSLISCELVNCGDDAVEVRVGANVTLRSCTIESPSDDGVGLDNGTLTMEGCLIENPGGVGVYGRNGSTTLDMDRVRIVGAGDGGVWHKGSGSMVNVTVCDGTGHGIEVESGKTVEIVNCTIAYMTGDGINTAGTTLTMRNTISAHNAAGVRGTIGGSGSITNNMFWDNSSGHGVGGVSLDGTNLTSDPMFMTTAIPKLSTGSPAIDTGIDATSWTTVDIDNRSRPALGGWDFGAYEWDPSDAPLFTDVSAGAGYEKTLTNNYAMYVAGLHWGDVDSDGDLDCFATGSSAYLFKNDGDGTFTAASFSNDPSRQGALADFDNDGDLDYWGGRSLYYEAYFENNGVGGFSYEGNAGFPEVYALDGVSSNDFDGDGWCDMVVCGTSKRWYAGNDGSGSLNLTGDDSSSTGLSSSPKAGDNTSSGDVNGDGLLDVFHHSGTGKLFLSDGDGTFTYLSPSGINESMGGNYDKRGSAWGDYDNDGDLDLLYCAENSGDRVRLYQNGIDWDTMAGSFTDVSGTAGLSNTGVQRGCAWGDYDNDGDLDLVLGLYDGADVIYENQGAPNYNFVALDGEPMSSRKTNDIVFVDYDNDGDLDIASSNESGDSVLLKNSTNDTNYLKVRVVGSGAGGTPKSANGVKVELYAADGTTYLGQRTIFAARGFGGTEPQWAHFGVSDPAAGDVVKVYFNNGLIASKLVTPSAVSSTIGGNPVAQMVTIEEGDFGTTRPTVVRWDEVSPVD